MPIWLTVLLALVASALLLGASVLALAKTQRGRSLAARWLSRNRRVRRYAIKRTIAMLEGDQATELAAHDPSIAQAKALLDSVPRARRAELLELAEGLAENPADIPLARDQRRALERLERRSAAAARSTASSKRKRKRKR